MLRPFDQAQDLMVYAGGLSHGLCAAMIALSVEAPDHRIETEWRRCAMAPVAGELLRAFKRELRPIVTHYRRLTSVLNFCTELESPNVLRYDVGREDRPDHFHEHADAWNVATATRQVSIIAYLNDVADGGETVFPQQRMTFQPREGSVLLFPSNYAYTHLADPPRSGSKCVAVTWLHFGGDGVRLQTSPLESDA